VIALRPPLFALLLRRLESSNSLLLDFLTLALSFRLGRRSLALLLRCQPLFPCLLHLAVGFRLGRPAIFLLGRSAIFLRFKFGLLHARMPNECVAAHTN